MLYNLYAGLGGGFGGNRYKETAEFDTEDEACDRARELAVEEYEGTEGCHGIASRNDIVENHDEYGIDDPNDEEAIDAQYSEEVESWISYEARLASNDERGRDDEEEWRSDV